MSQSANKSIVTVAESVTIKNSSVRVDVRIFLEKEKNHYET
jgi:hypothetical protein